MTDYALHLSLHIQLALAHTDSCARAATFGEKHAELYVVTSETPSESGSSLVYDKEGGGIALIVCGSKERWGAN